MKRVTWIALAALMPVSVIAAEEPQIYGLHEYVNLHELQVKLPAKLDTGAETASLSARNIEVFKKDGGEWVRFQLGLDNPSQAHVLEKPLVRMSYIKRRAGDREEGDAELYTERPVVAMDICLGDELQNIEVNLTDRSDFKFPLLIGSTVLKEMNAAVSPNHKFSAGQPSCGQTS
ncbi:ATP-dependent zinc protease [Ectopseudomonas mendocina]|uniref:ATP-dependent zinc protease n=1 Tax=Ectopseudomonas mendocina TaxID=300 RepID=A0ABZ2RTV2_ECTME